VTLPPYTYIDTARDWEHALAELSRVPRVAVDLEANSLYVYRERICLVQLSTDTQDYILDPLADIPLDGLGRLLADPAIEKVFHASEYDLMLLKREYDFEVVNLFDTMWAARLLGHTHMGLAGFLLEHFDVTASKKYQKANWGERPLTAGHLEYAQIDTHYLLRLRDIFVARIEEAGRMNEAREIFANACRPKISERVFSPDDFWRLKGARELKPRAQAILKALFVFRENEAQRRDLPPFKVLPNHLLIECAAAAPEDRRALSKLPSVSPKLFDRFGDKLLKVINAARNAELPEYPRRGTKRTDPAVVARYDRLFQWRKELAQKRGVESDVILHRNTLWEIAHANPESRDVLAGIKGIGPQRLDLYATDILSTLAKADD